MLYDSCKGFQCDSICQSVFKFVPWLVITFESTLVAIMADHHVKDTLQYFLVQSLIGCSSIYNILLRKISRIISSLEWALIHVTMLDSLRYTKLSQKAITNVSNFYYNKGQIPMFNLLMGQGTDDVVLTLLLCNHYVIDVIKWNSYFITIYF